MNRPDFVYVTYISTTPEKLWNALTEGEITRLYWHHTNVSDWKPGSAWQHVRLDEAKTVDIVGKVVESDPPRRLVLTWASPAAAADPARNSRVTFEIETVANAVRLVVTHDELEGDPAMGRSIANGWPKVLSSLKSLLETGQPLPRSWSHIMHLTTIHASPERVYEALTTAEGIRAWWTRDTSLDSKVGGTGEFGFYERQVLTKVRLTALDPPRHVAWQTTSSNAPGGWEGTTITFDLQAEGDNTVVSFAHRGFKEANEGYARVTTGWGFFLASLQQYLETGTGTPR